MILILYFSHIISLETDFVGIIETDFVGIIDVYLFSLVDENAKSIKPVSFERHWRIPFQPDR